MAGDSVQQLLQLILQETLSHLMPVLKTCSWNMVIGQSQDNLT